MLILLIFDPPVVTKDYSEVINEECGVVHDLEVSSLEFSAETTNCDVENQAPKVLLMHVFVLHGLQFLLQNPYCLVYVT